MGRRSGGVFLFLSCVPCVCMCVDSVCHLSYFLLCQSARLSLSVCPSLFVSRSVSSFLSASVCLLVSRVCLCLPVSVCRTVCLSLSISVSACLSRSLPFSLRFLCLATSCCLSVSVSVCLLPIVSLSVSACLLPTLLSAPRLGAADAEIKVPSGENAELKRSPFKAWSRSAYSHTCYAYC